MTSYDVSVCIPVYNGMDNLLELIDSLRKQERVNLEIVVIDSTSTDGSWEFLQEQDDIKSIQIPKSEFSHGSTRQRLAELVSNEVVIYLTQDATPSGNLFAYAHAYLHHESIPRVGAVLGAQHPRRYSAAAISQRVERTFKGLGPNSGVTLFRNDEMMQIFYGRQPLSFLSDVNASYKRSILLSEVKFRNLPYAEDQYMASDLFDAGYDIVYSPQASVLHVNDISASAYAKRIEDELVGVYSVLKPDLPPRSFALACKSVSMNLIHDAKYIIRQRPQAGYKWALKQALLSPVYEIQYERGYTAAKKALKNL